MRNLSFIYLVLLLYADWYEKGHLVKAFGSALIRTSNHRRRATFIRLVNPEDNDSTSDENGRSNNPDDSEALQQELNAMMAQSSSSSTTFDVIPPAGQDEDATDIDLYNAAPLFTGAVVTVFSIAFTGYLIYAGITGDDPLSGHPLN